jgi:hypothetical protein
LAPDPEPVSAEAVEVTVDTAWPTTDEGAVVADEGVLSATTVLGLLAAVLGLLAADAGLAVRNESPRNTPKAATAIPAAHRQGRRTLVTGPSNRLVTSVTITRHSWLV